MPDDFDPYYKWLGIPPKDQPPHHYRLLGVELFEPDADVIDAAANRLIVYLQDMAAGADIGRSQKLLNEISAARRCLLTDSKRRIYDAELQLRLVKAPPPQTTTAAPPAPPPPPVAPPPAGKDSRPNIVVKVRENSRQPQVGDSARHSDSDHLRKLELPQRVPPTATSVSGISIDGSAIGNGDSGPVTRGRSSESKSRRTLLWISAVGTSAIVIAVIVAAVSAPPKAKPAVGKRAGDLANRRATRDHDFVRLPREIDSRPLPTVILDPPSGSPNPAGSLPKNNPPPKPAASVAPPAEKPAERSKPKPDGKKLVTPAAKKPTDAKPAVPAPRSPSQPPVANIDLAKVWPATLDLPRYPTAAQFKPGELAPLGPPLELGSPTLCQLSLVEIGKSGARNWFEMAAEGPADSPRWRVELVNQNGRAPIARYRWQGPTAEKTWQLGFEWLPTEASGGADRLRNVPLQIRVGDNSRISAQRSCQTVPPLALMGPVQPTFYRGDFDDLPPDADLRMVIVRVAPWPAEVKLPPIEIGTNKFFPIPNETEAVARIFLARSARDQLLIEAKVFDGQKTGAKNQWTHDKIESTVAETQRELSRLDPENRVFRNDAEKANAKANFATTATSFRGRIDALNRLKTLCSAARLHFIVYFQAGEQRVELLKSAEIPAARVPSVP